MIIYKRITANGTTKETIIFTSGNVKKMLIRIIPT